MSCNETGSGGRYSIRTPWGSPVVKTRLITISWQRYLRWVNCRFSFQTAGGPRHSIVYTKHLLAPLDICHKIGESAFQSGQNGAWAVGWHVHGWSVPDSLMQADNLATECCVALCRGLSRSAVGQMV